MKKGHLINEVSKVVKTKKDAQTAVDCVFSSITKALEKGDARVSRKTHLEGMASNGVDTVLTATAFRCRRYWLLPIHIAAGLFPI
jgi:nucleoid DNA-binding protein